MHVAPMASGRQMAAGSVLPRPQREGRQGQGRQANFEEVGAFVLHGRGALREEQRHCVRRGRGAGRARRCRAWHCTRWAEPPRDLRGSTGAMLSKRPRLRRRARRPHLVHPHRLHHVVHTAGVPHPRAPRGVRRRRVRERPAPLGLHRERPVRAAPEVGETLQHRRGSLRAHVRARMGARARGGGGQGGDVRCMRIAEHTASTPPACMARWQLATEAPHRFASAQHPCPCRSSASGCAFIAAVTASAPPAAPTRSAAGGLRSPVLSDSPLSAPTHAARVVSTGAADAHLIGTYPIPAA